MPGVAVRGADHAAPVVWAQDETGKITGGQRILIERDGSKVDSDVGKPGFGSIGGSVGRFPARAGQRTARL